MGVNMPRSIFALRLSFGSLLVLLATAAPAVAETKADILRSLNYRKGIVTLGDNLASLRLTDKLVYPR